VAFTGRISYNRTCNPRRAHCHAASQPAKPAPIILIRCIKKHYTAKDAKGAKKGKTKSKNFGRELTQMNTNQKSAIKKYFLISYLFFLLLWP
jgi:hypothetical protein